MRTSRTSTSASAVAHTSEEEAVDTQFELQFNPLVALQSLISADVLPNKQRVKAAQQLENYFRTLVRTPGLLLSYEPYLPLVTEIMVTPVKGAQELQTSVLSMLQTLSSHNPYGFGDWIARNTQLGNEPWFVQWSYALLLQTEKYIPRLDDDKWDDKSVEFQEFDRTFARIIQMWRTLLDHTGDEVLVSQLVKCLQSLRLQEHVEGAEQWQAMLFRKLQPHFVDIADVLIGWTMNTGPINPLREDIIAFLHCLNRLWSDNSVFSLQLLNSFADEIVNLCDSWEQHQPGDDDRLSTLVTCFMLVAQCVSDLALSGSKGSESPFLRVLRRVASCPQPEYSLHCIASCSEYLVTVSNSRHSSFPSLSIVAARFLLYHCAVRARTHDSEVSKLSSIMRNSYKLINDNFSRLVNPQQVDVVGMLEDDIPLRVFKKGQQPKRVNVLECLLQVNCANGIKYASQLCLLLVRIGGFDSLKVLGTMALQCLNNRKADRRNSYFVFTATCFILASRNPEGLQVKCDDLPSASAFLELVAEKLDTHLLGHGMLKLAPRQLCLVLKMACAFIGTTSQSFVDRGSAVQSIDKVLLRILKRAIDVMPIETSVLEDHRVAVEILRVTSTVLPLSNLVPVIPIDLYRVLVTKLKKMAHCGSEKVRQECVQVLERLGSRADAHAVASEAFGLSLDLLLDPSGAVQNSIVSGKLSTMAGYALLDRVKQRTPHNEFQPLQSSFVSTDFEAIMRLLHCYKCDINEWHRVCRIITNRQDVAVDSVLSNSAILLNAVRQAAMWCVQNRLRTHFGGPAQTFSSIERLLMEHRNGHNAAALSTRNGDDWSDSFNRPSEQPSRLTTCMLLEFVGALELRIIHAMTATDMDQNNPESESYKTALFFRTNKAVCDDWLHRIRPFMLDISRNGGSREFYRHHNHATLVTCYSKLAKMMSVASREVSEKVYTEVQQAEKDVDIALYSVCRCYSDAKDVDSIVGFQIWGEPISSALVKWYQLNNTKLAIEEEKWRVPLFRWMNAVRFEAEMRYEDAAAEYECLLQPVLEAVRTNTVSMGLSSVVSLFESPMIFLRFSPPVLLGCFKHCAKCYASLRQWTKLRQLVTQFMDVAQALADCDRPIEGIQMIFDCSDTWRDEISAIVHLEAQIDVSSKELTTSNDLDNNAAKRSLMALRAWSVFSDTDNGHPLWSGDVESACDDRVRKDLYPLVLQPVPWNGYTGESIGKNAEQTVLKVVGLSKSILLPALVNGVQDLDARSKICKLNPAVHDSTIWSQPFRTPNAVDSRCIGVPASTDADCLYLTEIAKLARKQHNCGFARSLLTEVESIKRVSEASAVAVINEKARLLETIGLEDESRCFVETQCETRLASIRSSGCILGEYAPVVRSLLYLASAYARTESSELLSPATVHLLDGTISRIVSDGGQDVNTWTDIEVTPDLHDAAVHKCLKAAVCLSPTSATAWLHYSHWCYHRGKREMEQITEQNGYIHLEPSDELKLNNILNDLHVDEPDRDAVIRVFCRFQENGEIINQRLDPLRQLCINRAPSGLDTAILDRLLNLQRSCHSKILRFHLSAARGYGKYFTVLHDDDTGGCIPKQKAIMIALRLLGLLTTYGAEEGMLSILEDVFCHGPVTPWSYVIPQLIARVHHPVPAVSYLVCIILKRLARKFPHAIVYPAIVESMEAETALAASNATAEQSPNNMFVEVLKELQDVSAGRVEGVRLLVSELRRISILWDEAWISTLMKLSSDVARRTSTLEKEAIRVEKNASLSVQEKEELAKRKMVAIMKPILLSVERLWKETCGNTRKEYIVSPHERKFLRDFGGSIEMAIASFREFCTTDLPTPQASEAPKPQDLWQPFANILKLLLNSTGRRDQLPLRDISPAMASTTSQLALTNIPGAFSETDTSQVERITIHRVEPSVAVLRTKTKPKTLEFVGSDGRTYKYLLKAREDLRLDERIMQFLRISNEFLLSDNAASARDLCAQSYSVIPLSRNAGLIQMVPDVIPLFQVYTSRNEQSAPSGRAPQEPTLGHVGDHVITTGQPPQPPPPTAQFYAKLKQHGIANVSPTHRAQWPVPVLKKVYQELVAQRPRNVLQQEILLQSEDLRESWVKNARLSKSLAVMSVLGYLVGLGDRHLDNILLCVKSGDIVHIDHNVCFDKGRRLKVPEIVPFRLTPMLQDALGFTGIEGTFRVALETTLRVVRADNTRESLLTLLEAFVYSPLVDWIVEDNRRGRSSDLKARLEVNVNLSLFLSRAEERRQDTIVFGREYEKLADAISTTIMEAEVPFVELLYHRRKLRSFEREEQMLQKAVLDAGTELHSYLTSQQAKEAVSKATETTFVEQTAKLTAFANECLARHQQIETWRRKLISFAESATAFDSVSKAVEATSFRVAHATFCAATDHSRLSNDHRNQLATLEPKCHTVDMDVQRVRLKIEKLSAGLRPYLVSYGKIRKELDVYLDSELGGTRMDVYFKWWAHCARHLRTIEGANSEMGDDAELNVDSSCNVPFSESVAESVIVLRRIDELRLQGAHHRDDINASHGVSNDDNYSYLLSEVDQLIENVWDNIDGMKLSNAEGQRFMKLAGSSWIIEILESLNNDYKSRFVKDDASEFPMLITSPLLQTVVGVSHSCATLLELVSTPKGSMNRLRASELFAATHQKEINVGFGKSLNLCIDLSQVIMLFGITFQQEFLFKLRGVRSEVVLPEDLLRNIETNLATPDGRQEIKSVVMAPRATGESDVNCALQDIFAKHCAVRSVFAAAFAVTDSLAMFIDELHQSSLISKEEVADINNSSEASWMQLSLSLVELYTAESGKKPNREVENEAVTLWLSHMDSFLSSCLIKLLRRLLLGVISSEWKFDFCAPESDRAETDGDSSTLKKQWSAFLTSQIPDILPSTFDQLPNGAPEARADKMSSSVKSLMNVCERWWAQQWKATQFEICTRRLSSVRTLHEGRLRYAAWMGNQSVVEGELSEEFNLTRHQLLTYLSSEVPNLTALIAEQSTVEVGVLELAQQLGYIASEVRVDYGDQDVHHENLHDFVQRCYTNVVALFEYGRTLADLVQGASIIESSTREFVPGTSQVELEVDAVGETILQTAVKAEQDVQLSRKIASELDARVRALQDELQHKQSLHDAVTSKKQSSERLYHSLCIENEDATVKIARVLSSKVRDMLSLLKAFDKFKVPSQQTSGLGKARLQIQSSSSSSEWSSTAAVAGYSFMENDRLVAILLRSIRSVKHLKLLENVLEKHGERGAAIRKIIPEIDQVLHAFSNQLDQLLAVNEQQAKLSSRDVDSDSQLSTRACSLLHIFLDLIENLRLVESGSEERFESKASTRPVGASLLTVGRDLVRECVMLFFEATDMADRFSTSEDENHGVGSGTAPLEDETEEEEEQGDTDDVITVAEGNSDVLGTDSGNGSNDSNASPSLDRTEPKSQYGLQVLKRIEDKLLGIVTEMTPVMTVEQQAAWLIDEATNVDNLCVMYEGWTPWI